jgi:NAD(P)-dependent dehydrogenase (short-subunit alcohol dehydrogenase family)
MTHLLVGKVAAVTGAGAGIGRASALALAAQGATIAVIDLNEARATAVTQEIIATGAQAISIIADISTATGVEQVTEKLRQELGGLDILHNNAGIQRYGTVVTTPEDEWDEVFRVNVKSVYLLSRACVPLILERGGGSIINTGSVQSLGALANSAGYVATKHAILGLTRSMALDLAPHIRVNCICPGSVDTPMLRASQALSPEPEAAWQSWEHLHVLKRVAQPEEIGSVVAFLAGPGASFITGAAIPIDGGMLIALGGPPEK